MKIGSSPSSDPAPGRRGASARSATPRLFVDANGAFSAQAGAALARSIRRLQTSRWFEEPVTSDDPAGLRFVREHAPAGMEIAAGEYGYDLDDFRSMLEADAVDVLQADVTRCGGVTGFLDVGGAVRALTSTSPAHCAPSLHRHVACAAPRLRHLEWFHDHVRIEQMLFDGAPTPCDGEIAPDLCAARGTGSSSRPRTRSASAS